MKMSKKNLPKVTKISFETIFQIWSEHLWNGRTTPIKHISSMLYLGGYDMSIYNNDPTFFAIKVDGKVVAVNSGHMTIDGYYRSRGLWVDEQHRKKGYTYLLFDALCEQASVEKSKYIWSYPRLNSVGAYVKNGFTISSVIEENELGPHCYVVRSVSHHQSNVKSSL